MVNAFLIIAGLLAILVLAMVLRPLWRKKDYENAGPLASAQAKANGDEAARLAVYRDRRLEIEGEREAGRLSADEAAAQQQELVDEVAREFGQSEMTSGSKANPWAASTLSLAGLILAGAVYLAVGAPSLIDSAAVKQKLEDARNPEKVIATMESRVKSNPKDGEAWSTLGAAYKFTGDLPKARAAFETYFRIEPAAGKQSAGVMAEYAEVLVMSNGNSFEGKPTEVLTQALKLDPDEPKVLAMMGAAQFRAGNFKEARVLLGRLLEGMPADSPEAEHLRPLLSKIDERIKNDGAAPSQAQASGAGSTPGTSPHGAAGKPATGTAGAAPAGATEFSGTLVLSPKAREADALKETKAIFLSIRPATPGAPPMPLAAIKLEPGPAAGWPLAFTIGDAQAMNKAVSIAQVGNVLIEAHLSRTGQPGKKPGDWFGRLTGLDASKGKQVRLELKIDQQQP